jgi:hypothetical protein
VKGKRGRLPKLMSDLELAIPSPGATICSSSSRDVLVNAIVESISSRLEENGACNVLVSKLAEHISNTVTLDQMAESIARDFRDEVLAKLGDAMVARICKHA